MKLTKSAEKLDTYHQRLARGEARRIKPGHVEKVIQKLTLKKQLLEAERDAADKVSKKIRLDGKIATAAAQIDRAHWLLDQITTPDG